jgi:hypothetical protein
MPIKLPCLQNKLLSITTKLLDFVHRPDFNKQKTQCFGNWICFQNILLCSIYNFGWWTKSRNPVILSVIHRHQNHLDSMFTLLINGMFHQLSVCRDSSSLTQLEQYILDSGAHQDTIELGPHWSFLRMMPSLWSVTYRWVSPTKRTTFIQTVRGMPFIYELYSVGDRMEPCGTSACISVGADISLCPETEFSPLNKWDNKLN